MLQLKIYLTDDQKTNWENTKADFWTTVDSKVSTPPLNRNLKTHINILKNRNIL